ncbi:hypothetical protein MK805_13760 [Shimazuella sp. AN120528]|uniref:hypothetical protein n=1 Tax=Shimazuella soli TaxID=1892854 RepID=UPI001F11119C|nr:hypothetical protein [Shimazuella soli]MCH5586007.1 hypothetical protein [Shimazuella soli]
MQNLSERDKTVFGLTDDMIAQIKDVARKSGATIDPEQFDLTVEDQIRSARRNRRPVEELLTAEYWTRAFPSPSA